ncbi:hypothetical protein PYCC9005_005891 [Savitreella phatthalungensis]
MARPQQPAAKGKQAILSSFFKPLTPYEPKPVPKVVIYQQASAPNSIPKSESGAKPTVSPKSVVQLLKRPRAASRVVIVKQAVSESEDEAEDEELPKTRKRKRVDSDDDFEPSDAESVSSSESSQFKQDSEEDGAEVDFRRVGDDDADDIDADSDDDVSDVLSEPTLKRPTKRVKTSTTSTTGPKESAVKTPMDLTHLPPINDLNEMFEDMIRGERLRAAGFEKLLRKLDGRKLRVATMCSGTESPLLALSVIAPLVSRVYGKSLAVEHVFSCEIEPFKQAYIERNFQPPLLFRDVCELGDEFATTAYGAKVKVPGDIDILIAGTSCVDFSNLNNSKQEIDGTGQSARTFGGMLRWVKKHRPTVVILENVLSAPWEKSVCPKFRAAGYDAEWLRVDTKSYYIPHTRQRGYMCAIDRGEKTLGETIPHKWRSLVQGMARPASSPIEAFLMAEDDPRTIKARTALANAQSSRNAIDWARCEVRHRNARFTEELGDRRPLTLWVEGGGCTMPDYAWNDWAVLQPERVLDLLDISIMRYAIKGVDAAYKTMVWNLSQNVDRIGYPRGGLCPCMTPSMIPYISNRGGPMTGYEALGMQGLPLDKLLLTRETEDNCMDLAGNAMSTTVIGAVILAALTLSEHRIKDRDVSMVQERTDDITSVRSSAMQTTEFDLGAVSHAKVADWLSQAQRSRRLCACEGQSNITARKIYQCRDCGFTACSRCMGRPQHNFELLSVDRIDPLEFAKALKQDLPMRLLFKGTSDDGSVQRALTSELRFTGLQRREIWTAGYASDVATLELVLDPALPEWRLFVIPDKNLASNSADRKRFSQPVARLVLDRNSSLLDGQWQVLTPEKHSFKATFTGGETGIGVNSSSAEDFGDLVPSWEMSLGIQTPEIKNKRVWRYLDIAVDPSADGVLDRPISGRYHLHDKCAAAGNSLHFSDDSGLFFFLDPGRCTPNSMDSFVFAINHRRLEYGEVRAVTAVVAPEWRQNPSTTNPNKVSTSTVSIEGVWRDSDVVLEPVPHQLARLSSMTPVFEASAHDCSGADCLLSLQLPLESQSWPTDWQQVDKLHEARIFKKLSWLTERLRLQLGDFASWQKISGPFEDCARCAPTPPRIRFREGAGRKIVGIEDIGEAGAYEQALKKRPPAFAAQYRLRDGQAQFRIGLNIASMAHLAISRLPDRGAPAICSWRLDNTYIERQRILPSFSRELAKNSNKAEVESEQPPGFRLPLRREQLRSLTWMLAQEREDVTPFVEEETVEALLSPLGWRAEVRATREVHVRGGVLADEVGYGKTAISLGLIAASPEITPPDTYGYVSTKATLIIVPAHLIKQWPAEVEKFLGHSTRCIKIENMAHLKRLTVQEIQAADIVCVQVSLFKMEAYLQNLSALGASTKIPLTKGRHFQQCHSEALAGLKETVELLKQKPSSAHERIRGSADPWGLRKAKDASKMLCPTLELFHWSRLVIDEYTYLEETPILHRMAMHMRADRRWILSGTPPVDDFAAIKTISVFLGINLGVDDVKPARDSTQTEKFHSFREVKSSAWHLSRYRQAERFLRKFVRQNKAEIDEIPSVELRHEIILPAAERAIYLELLHHLQALDMNIKKIRKGDRSDREMRIADAFGESDSAEEALLKRCSHFDLDREHDKDGNAILMCDALVAERTKQLRDCELDLYRHVWELLREERKNRKHLYDPESILRNWLMHMRNRADDADATNRIQGMISLCEGAIDSKRMPDLPQRHTAAFIDRQRVLESTSDNVPHESAYTRVTYEEDPEKLISRQPDAIDDLRRRFKDKSHQLKRLEKELVGRERSLRFFEVVRDLQRLNSSSLPEHVKPSVKFVCPGPNCTHRSADGERLALQLADVCVFSTCGHVGCYECLELASRTQSCPAEGCQSPGVMNVIVRSTSLGEEEDIAKESVIQKHFGTKLEEVIKLINSLPKDEKVLLFCQFKDLTEKVVIALEHHEVQYLRIVGSASQKSKALQRFQQESSEDGPTKVLVLNITDESASGANLTGANHVIFVSPILADSLTKYTSQETQAIGRALRYGQRQKVHVHRFITLDSIDVDTYDKREREKAIAAEEQQQMEQIL